MIRSTLYLNNTLSWISIVASSLQSPHSDASSWSRANQPLLFLLNTAYLVEKQHIPIVQYLVWPDLGSIPRSTALEASTLIITTPMRFVVNERKWISAKSLKSYVVRPFVCPFSIHGFLMWGSAMSTIRYPRAIWIVVGSYTPPANYVSSDLI